MGMFVNGQWMKTHPDYLSESVLEPPAKKSRRPAVRRQLLDDVPPPSLPPSLPADRQIRADFPVDTELEQRAPLPSSSPAAISRTRSRRAHSREVAQTEGLLAAVMPAPSGGGIPCTMCKKLVKNTDSLKRLQRKIHKGRKPNDLID